MTKKEAEQWLADHEKLSRLVFGHGTDAKIEKRGKNWVGILPIKKK